MSYNITLLFIWDTFKPFDYKVIKWFWEGINTVLKWRNNSVFKATCYQKKEKKTERKILNLLINLTLFLKKKSSGDFNRDHYLGCYDIKVLCNNNNNYH